MQFKKEDYPNIANIADLNAFIANYEKNPDQLNSNDLENDNQPIIFFKNLTCDDLIVCFSRDKLLRNVILQNEKDYPFISVDGTYKILKIGYPLLILMTIDRRFKGYPVR